METEELNERLAALNDDDFEDVLNRAKEINASNNNQEEINNTEKQEEIEEETTEEEQPEVEEESEEDKVIEASGNEEESTTSTSNDTLNYEEICKSIFKPFKANGKEITPRSVNDVVSLMQMGANYTKKMQTIAPMKKTIESLNKANITDEDLSFLIDLHKGNKDAIKSLLKKNNLDPMDLDINEETNYSRDTRNIVSDKDVEFATTLDDIKDVLPKINSIISDKWDAESKRQILENPRLLKGLAEEIEYGRFDDVQKILDEERMYGRYKDVPDVEAYSDIVTKIMRYKAQQMQQQAQHQQVQQVKQPTRNTPDKTKAAPIRSKTKNQGRPMTSEDIFSMSDEEFNKLSERDLF